MKIKGLFAMILLLGLCVLAIGCSKEKEAEEAKGKDKVSENVELVMYSWRPEDREMYEKAIEAFRADHPNINVKFQPYKSTEYNTILTNALVSGKGPDIIQLRPYSGATTIADNEYLLPLDDLAGIENINEQYLDAARGSNGKIYGVPLSLNSGVIFYNKDIFEKYNIDVPATWDEFIEANKTLKENDVIPIAQSGRAAYLLSMTHAVLAPTAFNGNEYVEDIMNGNATLEDPRFVESVQRMKDMAAFFPEDFIALEDDAAKTLMFTGEAAMYINGDYRLETFESTAPDLALGVIPGFAEKEGEPPLVTTWVDGSYAAVKSSEHQSEALLFMEYLASQEFGQLFSDEVNRLSAVNGVVPEHPIVQQIAEANEKNPTPYLMLVHFGDGEPTTKTVFENALQGLYLDKLTIDGVISESQENADRSASETE